MAAVSSALIAYERNALKTRTLATEVLFALAPHTKIGTALQQFGTKDGDTFMLVLTIDEQQDHHADKDSFTDGDRVHAAIEGTPIPLCKLDALIDDLAIIRLYKLTILELSTSNLVDSCISRMACKTF